MSRKPDLTGSAPQPASASLAGTTHDLDLSTTYYKATIPVWLDLVGSPAEWAESFLSAEAGEVLAALGGLVVAFPTSGGDETRELVRQVGRLVRDGLGGWSWDGVGLAVGLSGAGEAGEGAAEDEWDELCAEAGLEFVHVVAGGGGGDPDRRNEFGGMGSFTPLLSTFFFLGGLGKR